MKAARFRFYPTLLQRRQLAKELGHSRYVYNWALKARSELFKEAGVGASRFQMSGMLTELKKETLWLKEASSTVLAEAIEDIDNGFQRFFKKLAKYPRRKKYRMAQSCRYTLDKRQTKVFKDGELLKLPKLGACKVVWTSEVDVFPNTATVSRDSCGRWFISLQFDSQIKPNIPKSCQEIGIDLGLKDLVVTSNGEKIKPKKVYKKMYKTLKRRARHLSKARKKSNNRSKKRLRVARVHSKIANKRKDDLHKLSTSIVRRYRTIAIEDLSVQSMSRKGSKVKRKFNRAVRDCSWRQLRTFLEYKAKWYDRELIVIPRFQRSTGVCPDCGEQVDLSLADRSWTCPKCLKEHGRDTAAAKVILGIARSARAVA